MGCVASSLTEAATAANPAFGSVLSAATPALDSMMGQASAKLLGTPALKAASVKAFAR